MRLIEAKLKGKRPTLETRETPQQADVVDLMARLRASLEAKGAAGGAATRHWATAAAKPRKKPGSRKGRAA